MKLGDKLKKLRNDSGKSMSDRSLSPLANHCGLPCGKSGRS